MNLSLSCFCHAPSYKTYITSSPCFSTLLHSFLFSLYRAHLSLQTATNTNEPPTHVFCRYCLLVTDVCYHYQSPLTIAYNHQICAKMSMSLKSMKQLLNSRLLLLVHGFWFCGNEMFSLHFLPYNSCISGAIHPKINARGWL